MPRTFSSKKYTHICINFMNAGREKQKNMLNYLLEVIQVMKHQGLHLYLYRFFHNKLFFQG